MRGSQLFRQAGRLACLSEQALLTDLHLAQGFQHLSASYASLSVNPLQWTRLVLPAAGRLDQAHFSATAATASAAADHGPAGRASTSATAAGSSNDTTLGSSSLDEQQRVKLSSITGPYYRYSAAAAGKSDDSSDSGSSSSSDDEGADSDVDGKLDEEEEEEDMRIQGGAAPERAGDVRHQHGSGGRPTAAGEGGEGEGSDGEDEDDIFDDEDLDDEDEAEVDAAVGRLINRIDNRVDNKEDALTERIQNAGKKQRKFMLQQLLKGDNLVKELDLDVITEEESSRLARGGGAFGGGGGKGGRRQDEDDGHEPLKGFRMKIVNINRTCKRTRAGGTWSFSSMVVVGNGAGVLGYGSGKAADVNSSVKKAHARALRNLMVVHRYREATVYGPATSKYGKVKVIVYPKGQGNGIKASHLMSDICRLAGIKDIGVKMHGSRNAVNGVKALFNAFASIRNPQDIAAEQGKYVKEMAVGSYHVI